MDDCGCYGYHMVNIVYKNKLSINTKYIFTNFQYLYI